MYKCTPTKLLGSIAGFDPLPTVAVLPRVAVGKLKRSVATYGLLELQQSDCQRAFVSPGVAK